MKNFGMIFLLSGLLLAPVIKIQAQEQEIQQLVLNIEKLLQFRKILDDMKTGYETLVEGYGLIRDLSEGNFNLHQAFLDGLLQVSPTLRQYGRIAGIIQAQGNLVKEYGQAQRRFRRSQLLSAEELAQVQSVYTSLLANSARQVSDLAAVLTAGTLRMSDAERLAAIDRIYAQARDQLYFLRRFNNQHSLLLAQRARNKQDVNSMSLWYDR